MNQQRYAAYRSLVTELDEQNASWLLDAMLSCGPQAPRALERVA